MGMEFETTYRITEYETNARQGFKSLSGPIQFEGSYGFEMVGDGTRFTFTIQGETGKLLLHRTSRCSHGQQTGRGRLSRFEECLRTEVDSTLIFQANNLIAG